MHTGDTDARRLDLSRLTGVAVGLTFVLVLLGIYTAAVGAGLTCGRRWPLCDGAVFGLFPANWPSFVEWFHRLVAMITGFLILGTTVAAWRRNASRGVRYATTVATVFLPAQIVLGALTVSRYTLLVLAAHFGTAMVIFAALVLAAVWTRTDGQDLPAAARDRTRSVTLAALAVTALLTPRLFVDYSAGVQIAYYAAGMVALAGLLALGATARGRHPRTAGAASLGALVVFVELSIGRRVFGDAVQVALFAGALLAGGLLLLARYVERERETPLEQPAD